MYVVKTDRGYMGGDLHQGVTFYTTPDKARKFTLEEANLYRDSIFTDMFEFFDIEECCYEEL
jgi:hypothetical protein